jgi:CHAT domain-containing protein/tetratricopeptide (TPR) repeat protein
MKIPGIILPLLLSISIFAQTSEIEQWYKDGFEYYRKGEKLKAIEVFEKIFAADSTETDALDYKTILYGQTGQYAKAAEGCVKLSTLFPEKDDVLGSACFFYTLLNQPETAEKYGKKAVNLNSYRFNNMLNLAHTYLLQYKKEQAIYWYIRAMQWLPNRESFDRAFIGDLELIDSLKLMPANIVQQFKTGLTAECSALNFQSRASVLLDSILTYLDKKPSTEEKQKIIKWKNEFIEEEAKSSLSSVRYNVVAAFAVDIGLNEYRNRNRSTAMGYYFDRAESIHKSTGDSLSHAQLLIFLSRELMVYQTAENKYGKNSMILDYALAAREVVEKYSIDELQAPSLHQLAEAYFQKDDNEKGYQTLTQLLKWSDKNRDGKGYFRATNGLSVYFSERKNTDSAIYYNNLCLQSIEEAGLGKEQVLQIRLNGLDLLYTSGKFETVLLKAVLLKEELNQNQGNMYADICELEGQSWLAMNMADSAYVYFKEAVESYIQYSNRIEKMDKSKVPVQVNEERLPSLWSLCSIAAKRKDEKDLFKWSEMVKDNLLRYLVSFEYQPDHIATLEKARATLKADEAALVYTGLSLDQSPAFAFDQKNVKIDWINSDQILKTVQQSGLHQTFSTLLRLSNKQANTHSDSSGSAKLIPLMQYMYLSNQNPAEVRGIAIKREERPDDIALSEEKINLSKLLYKIYVQPFEPLLTGKKTILVSADNMLHFIPFETMMLPDGRYLGEVYDIVYIPGFTIRDHLENRTYNNGKGIIALGNPDYSTYHPEKLQGRALDYSLLGIKAWTDLPGTQQEINMLLQQFDSVTVFTGNALSETGLKKLSEDGKLNKAAILHFSLHGIAGTTSAKEDNSLVVTEPDNGTEDGLLQFYEAFELDIKAQLVCLSACETGLGMIDMDGSLATMGTAFLAAGARAVLATNWSINDAATALFIKDVYRQYKEQNIPFAQAVANTKRSFIKGGFGEMYKKPYYWAPFKYFGN